MGAAASHEIVFRGRVLASEIILVSERGEVFFKNTGDTQEGVMKRIAVLRIDEVFKGVVPPVATIVTGSGAGDCGFIFEVGKDYAVFADHSSDRELTLILRTPKVLTTSICTHTQDLANAGELAEALRQKFGSSQPRWIQWPSN